MKNLRTMTSEALFIVGLIGLFVFTNMNENDAISNAQYILYAIGCFASMGLGALING